MEKLQQACASLHFFLFFKQMSKWLWCLMRSQTESWGLLRALPVIQASGRPTLLWMTWGHDICYASLHSEPTSTLDLMTVGHSGGTWGWLGVKRCQLCLQDTFRSTKWHWRAAVGQWVSLCVKFCRIVDSVLFLSWPSVNRRSDDMAFRAGTFSWQDPVHCWKAGPKVK